MPTRLCSSMLLLVLFCGCTATTKTSKSSGPIRIVATTGMVADAVKQVGGTHVQVQALMGPGVDPHLFKPSSGDAEKLSSAEMIFFNGLHLEGKMSDVLEKIGRTKPAIAIAHALPEAQLRRPPEFEGQYDPHVWFDVRLWAQTLHPIAQALAQYDPAHAGEYHTNAARYARELHQLDDWCRTQLLRVPKAQRVLITAHDAFGYFGRAYDVEVMGLQGISTAAEFGVQDVTRLVRLIVQRGIRAVFVESSIPRRSIDAVVAGTAASGHTVRVGGELFSDALGPANSPEGTYVGMVRSNVVNIVNGLLGKDEVLP